MIRHASYATHASSRWSPIYASVEKCCLYFCKRLNCSFYLLTGILTFLLTFNILSAVMVNIVHSARDVASGSF